MTGGKKCLACQAETFNSFDICDDCVAQVTAEEREAQGLPAKVTDNPATAAWLARLLVPQDRIAS